MREEEGKKELHPHWAPNGRAFWEQEKKTLSTMNHMNLHTLHYEKQNTGLYICVWVHVELS